MGAETRWNVPNARTGNGRRSGGLNRCADERKKKERKRERNVRYFEFRKVCAPRDSVLGCSGDVNAGGRNDGRSYRRGTEKRAVLERTRSNRFSRWFHRRPCGLTARVTFPRDGSPRSLRSGGRHHDYVYRRYDVGIPFIL